MNIKKFFYTYDWTLISLGLFFVLIIGFFYAWGVGIIVSNFADANGLDEEGVSAENGFKVEAAKKILSDRGLIE